ncbi:MAG: TonB-dependent receptor [Daejeonella sp.]
MRINLTLVLLSTAFLQISMAGYAQKVTLSEKNASLEQVFKIIYNQTGYHFLYTDKLLNNARPVDIQIRNASLEEALNYCFEGQPLTYTIKNNTVIVQRKPVPSQPQAPPGIIKGKVSDSKGITLPGVTVRLEGASSQTTSTDTNGHYSFPNVPPGNYTLSFTYLGFAGAVKEVTLRDGQESLIDITLTEEASKLNEVVVVGYGTQKRVNVTGAISTVDMKSKEIAPLTNATQALQGVQGVYVNQAGGQPGKDNATIRIRGQGTLNNNNALVLVNGIEYPLSDVNPNDIESISVLKDAASAAIYGSRAANGVILVTTKSGKKGDFQVKYNNYFGSQLVNYLPDVVKDPIQFMELGNQAEINVGGPIVIFPQSLIDEYKAGMKTDPYTYPNNDWFDIMFNPGSMQDHNLQFSGGAENINYALSLDYLDQQGVMMGSNSKRYSLGFNTTVQVNRKLKIGSNINALNRIINEPVIGVRNMMNAIMKAQAFHPTYLKDGRYANTFVRSKGHNIYRHPLVLAKEGKNNTRQQQYLINLFAEYKLPFSINYKINMGINRSDDFNSTFLPDIYIYQNKTNAATRVPFNADAEPVAQKNRGTRNTNNSGLNTTLFNTLNWAHSLNGRHNLSALAGFSMESFSDQFFWAQNEGYLGNDLYQLNAGSSNSIVAGSSSSSRLNSYFGRLGYNYQEKYLFEANFRYDGSSRFARDKRWGLFPSFSAGWQIKREKWLENSTWLSDLKLRASWGQLGNERIGLFRYLNLINLGQDYSLGNNVGAGAAVNAYNDPNITWETTTISNLGIDAGIFGNKVNLVFDVFKKRTTDILRAVNLPAQVGNLAGPIRNIGTVDNTGFELGLNYQNRLNNFTYQVNGSVTKIKNRVISLNGQTIFNGNRIIREGYPINSYNLIHAIGIFQTQEEIKNSPFQTKDTKPGYIRYQDTNGDNVITEDDRVISGGVIPEYTYQFGLNLGYKGLEISSFFQGVQNIDTYASLIGAQPFWGGTSVTKDWITDSWTPQNRNARLPILLDYFSGVNDNFRASDFWLQDASYLRLKNLQVGYTLPQKVTRKFGVKNLKLFVNGQNLFTFSKMKAFDPEKNIEALNFYEYPTVKIYTAGINATF